MRRASLPVLSICIKGTPTDSHLPSPPTARASFHRRKCWPQFARSSAAAPSPAPSLRTTAVTAPQTRTGRSVSSTCAAMPPPALPAPTSSRTAPGSHSGPRSSASSTACTGPRQSRSGRARPCVRVRCTHTQALEVSCGDVTVLAGPSHGWSGDRPRHADALQQGRPDRHDAVVAPRHRMVRLQLNPCTQRTRGHARQQYTTCSMSSCRNMQPRKSNARRL